MAMAATTTSSSNFLPALGLANGRSLTLPQVSSRLSNNARFDHQTSSMLSLVKSTSESKRRRSIIAMATGETSTDPIKPVTDALKPVTEFWDKTDDKLAIGGLGFAALIVLWASTGLIAAIDKLPILPSTFEFIGILFSGWFTYRYLLFKPDREVLWKKVQGAISEITGQ